jgi:hypothetical protein
MSNLAFLAAGEEYTRPRHISNVKQPYFPFARSILTYVHQRPLSLQSWQDKMFSDEPFMWNVMQQYLTSFELCRLTGLPMGTLKRLRAAGSVLAAKPGGQGRGHADLWSLVQVLALAVARGLRSRGVSLEEAGPVLKYFWEMPTTKLEDHFRNGQTYLALFGTKVLPRLVTQDSIFKNERVDYSTAATEALLPAAIDVKLIWERIKAEAAKSDPKKETRTKRETVRK